MEMMTGTRDSCIPQQRQGRSSSSSRLRLQGTTVAVGGIQKPYERRKKRRRRRIGDGEKVKWRRRSPRLEIFLFSSLMKKKRVEFLPPKRASWCCWSNREEEEPITWSHMSGRKKKKRKEKKRIFPKWGETKKWLKVRERTFKIPPLLSSPVVVNTKGKSGEKKRRRKRRRRMKENGDKR